ncbi:unnamed protein product [Victoria cruziana]
MLLPLLSSCQHAAACSDFFFLTCCYLTLLPSPQHTAASVAARFPTAALLYFSQTCCCNLLRHCGTVCCCLAATIHTENRYKSIMTEDVPRIFEAVFECTLEMITKNFEDCPEHRLKFFSLLRAVAAHCFNALIHLSSQTRIFNNVT